MANAPTRAASERGLSRDCATRSSIVVTPDRDFRVQPA